MARMAHYVAYPREGQSWLGARTLVITALTEEGDNNDRKSNVGCAAP